MKKWALILLAVIAFTPAVGFAKSTVAFYPGFPSIEESKAYKKFMRRPVSDFSKILYLIDRFSEAQIEVIYEEQAYNVAFATTVARWFLARNYKKETPEEWINKWCSRSVFSNKLIFVKMPDGKYRPAHEILKNEIQDLNELLNQAQSAGAVLAAKAAVASAASPTVATASLNNSMSASRKAEIATA